ncbi:MAG: SDR family NAD(P)-dependent oxidoreductase [Streptosporangiaceae bacterium]
MRRVEAENGGLDLLLPNAGLAEVRSLDEVALAAWRSSLEVNLTAPYMLAQAAVPRMRERGAPGAVRRQPDARPRPCGAAGHRRIRQASRPPAQHSRPGGLRCDGQISVTNATGWPVTAAIV